MGKKHLLAIVLLLATIGLLSAQTGQVSGYVSSSEDGEPIIGASVLVKGFSIGAQTDIDGNFILERVPNDAKILVVSYMGMITKEVAIKPNLKITLDPDTKLLDEVVVTGLQRMDKRLFTGATDRISAEDAKLDGVPDLARALEGRSAGVSVQNMSGTFGAAPKIRIRGATSIHGNSKPLWVVDGVILEDIVDISPDALSSGDVNTLISSAISGLSPDDIESFQILKDGSATSIYGAKAMAGVIVVTTKRGKAGVSSFNYSSELTYRFIPSYRQFNIMNSQDQMAVYSEMHNSGWLNYADIANNASTGVYGNMYRFLNDYDPDTQTFGLKNDQRSISEYLRRNERINTDWFNELYNQNITQNHSVSLSSGSEKASHYASLSAMLDPGWTKQSRVNRYTLNFNGSYKLFKNLTFNILGGGSYRKQRAPGTLSQSTDVINGKVNRDFDINPFSFATNASRALDPREVYRRNYADFNIHHELDNNYIDLAVSDLRFQTELKWKVLRNVEISTLGALKYSATKQEHNVTEFSNQALAYRLTKETSSTIRDRNPFLYKDREDPYALPVSVLKQGGFLTRTDREMISYDLRTTISYNDVFNEKHILNLFGGMEMNTAQRHATSFKGWGMQYSMGETPFYEHALFKSEIEGSRNYYGMDNTLNRTVAFFSNLTYSWMGKYTFNGTLRYEGTNRLGKSRNARWMPTWNTSLAWNIHEESFFETLRPALSNWTLKGSYSLTADAGPASIKNSSVMLESYIPWKYKMELREAAIGISGLENEELTYEKKHELNLGTEFGLLKNRINISFDWYMRKNFDLIGPIMVQGVGGQTSKWGNVANMSSKGLEFSLSTTNITTKDFSWKTDFVYAKSTNRIDNLNKNTQLIHLVTPGGFAREGYPVRALFSIPYQGLNESGLPTFTNSSGATTVDGIHFQERENLDFLKYSGSVDPTDYGSLGNIFTYKNFRLNVFVTYSFGNVIRLDPVFKSEYSDMDAMPRDFLNRWVTSGNENKEGVVPVISNPRLHKEYARIEVAYNSYNFSDARIARGDFIRLKEISLNYDVPKTFTEKLNLNAISLKLQATNLCLLYADSKLKGQDPEFLNAGGVASPMPKQITFTLRVGL